MWKGEIVQQWEYRIVVARRGLGLLSPQQWDTNISEVLTTLGDQGCELAAVSSRSNQTGHAESGISDEELWVFKRPKGTGAMVDNA